MATWYTLKLVYANTRPDAPERVVKYGEIDEVELMMGQVVEWE